MPESQRDDRGVRLVRWHDPRTALPSKKQSSYALLNRAHIQILIRSGVLHMKPNKTARPTGLRHCTTCCQARACHSEFWSAIFQWQPRWKEPSLRQLSKLETQGAKVGWYPERKSQELPRVPIEPNKSGASHN